MIAAEIGVQSYTFRKLKLEAALDAAKDSGNRSIELWPGHLPAETPADQVEAVRALCEKRGLRVCGYGVVNLSRADASSHFRCAKALGADYVSVDFRPDDRQAQEAAAALASKMGLRLALHNHGPGHAYATPEQVTAVLEGLPAVMGACVDTGHFLRADADPVAAIRMLGSRVHAIHLKDFLDAHQEVLPGSGRLDLKQTIAALREVGFTSDYVLEYEADADNPVPAVREAVAAVQAALDQA